MRHASPTWRHWAPLALVLTGVFMSVLDFFIVNVAMPVMQGSLHASGGALEWVVAGYALSSSVLLIAGGRLGDRYGRRRMFSLGMALFTLSSAVCGAAPHITELIAGRLLQGAGGALMTSNVLSLLGILYPGEDQRRAMAAYGGVMGLAAVGGQLLGGVLVQADPLGLSWRACFLINLPIGAAALAMAPRLVPESRGRVGLPLDLPGLALSTAGLTAIVLPLVQGRQDGWPAWTWISLAAAPLILAVYAAQQRALTRRGGLPLIEPALLHDPRLRVGLVAQTVFWCGQGSFFLILALYLQLGRGLRPLSAGLVFTILAASYLVSSARSPELANRHGRRVITAAALTLAAGHGLLLATVAGIGTGGSVIALAPALVLIGAGMGLGIAPLATMLLSGLRPEQAGAASGALSTAQYVGNALGVAVVGLAFFGGVGSGYATALERGLAVLAGLLVCVAGLSRLLPAPACGAGAGAAAEPGSALARAAA
jgi:EmrB/QacA subfamily drug resistance transporter